MKFYTLIDVRPPRHIQRILTSLPFLPGVQITQSDSITGKWHIIVYFTAETVEQARIWGSKLGELEGIHTFMTLPVTD